MPRARAGWDGASCVPGARRRVDIRSSPRRRIVLASGKPEAQLRCASRPACIGRGACVASWGNAPAFGGSHPDSEALGEAGAARMARREAP